MPGWTEWTLIWPWFSQFWSKPMVGHDLDFNFFTFDDISSVFINWIRTFLELCADPSKQRVNNRKRQMSSLFIQQRVKGKCRHYSSSKELLTGKGKCRHYLSALRCVLGLARLFYFKLIERGREFRGPVHESFNFIYKKWFAHRWQQLCSCHSGPFLTEA